MQSENIHVCDVTFQMQYLQGYGWKCCEGIKASIIPTKNYNTYSFCYSPKTWSVSWMICALSFSKTAATMTMLPKTRRRKLEKADDKIFYVCAINHKTQSSFKLCFCVVKTPAQYLNASIVNGT
jgi:protein tyrosine phosphatase